MRITTGNIWDVPHEWVCITTCGLVKPDGHLVMGRGIALQAAQRYPDLPLKLGTWVSTFGNIPAWSRGCGIITWPTKYHWRAWSDRNLILSSARYIIGIVNQEGLRNIVFPAPGCGNGGLTLEDILPQIEPLLDDRFTLVLNG